MELEIIDVRYAVVELKVNPILAKFRNIVPIRPMLEIMMKRFPYFDNSGDALQLLKFLAKEDGVVIQEHEIEELTNAFYKVGLILYTGLVNNYGELHCYDLEVVCWLDNNSIIVRR